MRAQGRMAFMLMSHRNRNVPLLITKGFYHEWDNLTPEQREAAHTAFEDIGNEVTEYKLRAP